MSGWAVENWLEADAPETGEEYAEYWNDPEIEREKSVFDTRDGDYPQMESYLAETGLPADLEACLQKLREQGRGLEGKGIDLAAGTLWAAPMLLAAGPVERLYCLEFSRHRLLDIGPHVLEHYAVGKDRVVLAYGSFYDLRIPDHELDFAFLCQAFHHAERPEELLREMHRVLRPGGIAILIGEHKIGMRPYLAFAARLALPRGLRKRFLGEPVDVKRTLRPRGADLIPTDPVLGDHAYTDGEYARLFEQNGFAAQRVRRRQSDYQGFVLESQPR